MNTNALKNYEKWLAYENLDAETRRELEEIKGNEDEIALRFFGNLEFGTAGLRGVMSAGIARMNVYTVAHATQGLASLINSEGMAERGVCVAHDSRINSRLFAETTAEVLAANGIKVYIFDGLRPTPELSFALRYLNCIAGVNITASHNTKEYNGYKAYWEDGAQLPPDHAATVSSYINSIDIFCDVKHTSYDEAVKSGLIKIIGDEIDDAFLSNVEAERVCPPGFDMVKDTLKIVYTPIHGAGYKLVPRVLSDIGLKNIVIVEEQKEPDGYFPTVAKPNPELADVFSIGIEYAERIGSDLVLATDPDCDRVGVMSRSKSGKFERISGNEMGALLLDFILSALRDTCGIPKDAYAVKTIVSSEMAAKIASEFGIEMFNVLTGFKFIGEVIKNHEAQGVGTYILGFEESYGYLKGTYARDKDAVCASMLIGEMTAYYKAKGMTLCDAKEDLFARYGFFGEYTENVDMEGLDGIARRARITANLRENVPETIGGKKVAVIGDYKTGIVRNVKTGEEESTNLPSSDVLRYVMEDGDVVILRPSGTEPKIKIYFLSSAETKEALSEKIAAFKVYHKELLCD